MAKHKGPILGAHMSIAGGYYKAIQAAKDAGCDCVQIFSKNNNQWKAKPITSAEAEKFTEVLTELGILAPLAHASYLINLASPDDELRVKSVAALKIELERAEQLGLFGVVLHPGSFTTSTEEEGLQRIADGLNELHRELPRLRVRCLLENTAGQGTNLGHRFEHLRSILDRLEDSERVGICFDTCHAFAAGYPLSERKDYLKTMKEFDRVIGLTKIAAFHLNDSKRELGSRVDRHEHIGEGEIGVEAFAHLLNDKRFREVPMYLETPKGDRDGKDLDVMNLETLRGLLK